MHIKLFNVSNLMMNYKHDKMLECLNFISQKYPDLPILHRRSVGYFINIHFDVIVRLIRVASRTHKSQITCRTRSRRTLFRSVT